VGTDPDLVADLIRMKSPFLFAPPGHPQAAKSKADALFQQALGLHQGGQAQAALPLYEQVIQLNPKHSDALHLAGVLIYQQGDAQRAADLITRCIKIDRHNASAHANRGAALQSLGQLDLAMLNFNKAIELNPQLDSGWNNRANLLMKLERNTEALADLDTALSINPASFEAHTNRGNALSRMRRYEEAAASYRRAVELAPQATSSRWSLGMNLLRQGDFEAGWRHAEARLAHWQSMGWQARDGERLMPDTDLSGKSVLLHREQGLGDTLQFSRFAQQVHDRGARVTLEVQAELVDLLQPAYPFAQVVATGDPLPTFSHSCPLLSLPLVLGTGVDDIPPPPTRLTAPEGQRQTWRARVGEKRAPRVGITWSGNPQHVDDAQRSIAFADFSALLCEGIDWISLHKEVRSADEPALAAHPQVRSFGEHLHSFTDTAALIDQLDLVICVDSSVAHLAGSLGKETWVLLPFNADWRWLTERDDSPWYPGMTLLRQNARGDWADVLRRARERLMQRWPSAHAKA